MSDEKLGMVGGTDVVVSLLVRVPHGLSKLTQGGFQVCCLWVHVEPPNLHIISLDLISPSNFLKSSLNFKANVFEEKSTIRPACVGSLRKRS